VAIVGAIALIERPETAREGDDSVTYRSPPLLRHRPILRQISYALLGAGLLLLSFVAYQLWGTALYESHAQSILRQELRSSGVVSDHKPHAISARTQSPSARSGSSASSSNAAGSTPATTDGTVPPIAQPAVGQPVGLLSIPRIGMTDAAIVQGTDDAQLQQGPGHYAGTPLPGEAGNAAIAGHRTTYGHPFYDLNELQSGDLIYTTTAQGSFVYQVARSQIVDPSDTAVLDASSTPELTLTTCNPRYWATQRLVVVAFLQSATPASAPKVDSAPTSVQPAQRPTSLAGASPVAVTSEMGQVGQAVLWGTLAIALALFTRLAWRRTSGLSTFLVVVLGVPLVVTTLLICFQHVSLALPETF